MFKRSEIVQNEEKNYSESAYFSKLHLQVFDQVNIEYHFGPSPLDREWSIKRKYAVPKIHFFSLHSMYFRDLEYSPRAAENSKMKFQSSKAVDATLPQYSLRYGNAVLLLPIPIV